MFSTQFQIQWAGHFSIDDYCCYLEFKKLSAKFNNIKLIDILRTIRIRSHILRIIPNISAKQERIVIVENNGSNLI